MAESIRYLLDENVDPNVALALRQHGIDAITILEAGLRTCNDDDLLSFALREQRVIVTHDTDFLKLATQSHDHPGFAYSQMSELSLGRIIRRLILMYEVLTANEMQGRVEYLS